jgi:uncharacterized protein with GYD domain
MTKTGKDILAEAKASAKAKEDLSNVGVKPWYIRLFLGLFDTVAIVVILTLAVIGAKSLLNSQVGTTVALTIAIGLVIFLAARLVERAFAVKR